MSQELYIGVMSGNSLDNIDVVLADFADNKVTVVDSHSVGIASDIKEKVRSSSLAMKLSDSIAIDNYFARAIALAIRELMARNSGAKVKAIASHGQTVFHDPKGCHPISIQLGNPNIIAAKTGIDVISDFRNRDIAEGGEGAPLAPIFHEYLYADANTHRFIINIGGIANISHLSPHHGLVAGFDVGPGNILIDENINLALGEDFDSKGDWARSGKLLSERLEDMLQDDYFLAPYPKSTGREYFNRGWVCKYFRADDKPSDIQNTLTHLTAKTIADAVKSLAKVGEIVIVGGGAKNAFLVELITAYAPEYTLCDSEEFGLDPQLVEAVTFAYLAKLHCDKRRVNLYNITGAKRSYLPGVYYPA